MKHEKWKTDVASDEDEAARVTTEELQRAEAAVGPMPAAIHAYLQSQVLHRRSLVAMRRSADIKRRRDAAQGDVNATW